MTGLKFEKSRIREEMLEKRMAVPEEEKLSADKAMVQKLASLASFRFAEVILFYAPIKGEPDITEAVKLAVDAGKKVAFPKCDTENFLMTYKFVNSIDELVEGAYGIFEPKDEAESYIPSPYKHDICIVPAVCFDKRGYRIGYGKGYYDRFLSGFGGTAIGFTMNRFLQNELPKGKYDKTVDLIITEKGVVTPK